MKHTLTPRQAFVLRSLRDGATYTWAMIGTTYIHKKTRDSLIARRYVYVDHDGAHRLTADGRTAIEAFESELKGES